jgi:hypothetical protein
LPEGEELKEEAMRKTFLWIGITILLMAPLAAQSVKVVSPNGGESWALNAARDITWTAQNPGSLTVNVVLRHLNGGLVGPIQRNVALSSGVLHWTVGRLEDGTMAPAATDYIIRIRDAASTVGDDSDAAFAVTTGTTPVIIKVPPYDRVPPIFQKPKLAVSDIDLTPNADGFGIIFSYKNVGNGPLPKASEVPVKPSYRVLIDGKETASGSLFIPAFSAPPGWEQWGYNGGQIVLPSAEFAFDNNWYIGNLITVHINENKVMGMDSHSLTLNLKPIALKYRYDLVRNGISLDWSTRMLTVYLRLEGNVPAGRELYVYAGSYPSYNDYFMYKVPAKQGTYEVRKELKFIKSWENEAKFYLNSYVTIPNIKQVWDMDYRNNSVVWLKFTRPNPNPVQ